MTVWQWASVHNTRTLKLWSDPQSMFQCIPKVLDGVEVRALCSPVEFFHTKNHFFMELALCTGLLSCWKGKGLPQTDATKVGSTLLSNISYVLQGLTLRECPCFFSGNVEVLETWGSSDLRNPEYSGYFIGRIKYF